MEKEKCVVYKVCFVSATAVAIFTLLFVVALVLTYDFSKWTGIENYCKGFQPIQMLTVIPSLLLAFSYVGFVSGLHIYAPNGKKIWSQLALSFGLLYSGISIANYLIQLVTVIPSVQNGITEGLGLLVSGYSNSVFFALMASYFLMCISLFFSAFVFEKSKRYKWVRSLFACSALAIPLYLIGSIVKIEIIMMIGAMCWFIAATIGMLVLAFCFYKKINSIKLLIL